MAESMTMPKTAEAFIEQHKFEDDLQVYTNGAELISVLRVKQMMEHYFASKCDAARKHDEKIRTHHARIVVEGTAEKPYYGIEWYDPEEKIYCLGYGSYNIALVFGWLSEFFEIVERKTNAGRIRAMTDYELAEMLYCADSIGWCTNLQECYRLLDTEDGMPEERYKACLMKWLQQPAEGE